MRIIKLLFAISFAAFTALAITSCGQEPVELKSQIDKANAAAVGYLISQQSEDGAWRSETYGTLKDGITLTPPILKALTYSPPNYETTKAIKRAAVYLRSWVSDDGTIELDGRVPDFPVYSASLSLIALNRIPGEESVNIISAWKAFLRDHQLTKQLGWDNDDLAFGGWGYSIYPPKRPNDYPSIRPPFDSDLSSTLFAIGALCLTGAEVDDPAIQNALVFVKRCQNFSVTREGADDTFNDGGFFLTPTNELQNKAGSAGTDRFGKIRYHSYGSATADGIRALLRCGVPPDHPRVVGALNWLAGNFSTTTNPGTFKPMREPDRDAAYYYYCWSVSHAFRQLGLLTIKQDGHTVKWAQQLASEILSRQRDDGSWASSYSFVKEDDPLIATMLAAATLANCQQMLLVGQED